MIKERKDRRQRPTPLFGPYTFRGRRVSSRRSDDRKVNIYFDRYSSRVWFLFLSLLALNIFDAVMTLYHLQFGATESNPILDFFLQSGGESSFLIAKFVLAFSGTIFLFLHSQFKRVKVYTSSLVAIYAVLACYHISPFFINYAQLG